MATKRASKDTHEAKRNTLEEEDMMNTTVCIPLLTKRIRFSSRTNTGGI